MIKDSKGITLVSLIITIALMLIISSITISVSKERFAVNDFNKMINDIELLESKVSNYYLKYHGIPIVRDETNNPIQYIYTDILFNTNNNDNELYYILDLGAMEGISLNYGEIGYKNINSSDDVYIINEKSHQIYYVRGIELRGNIYHTIANNNTIDDNIPPTSPKIKIVSGTLDKYDRYITEVKVEIIPGKDNWDGINKTTYLIKDGNSNIIQKETNIDELKNNIYSIADNGKYTMVLTTYDKNNNISQETYNFEVVIKPNVSTEKGKGILSEKENTILEDTVGKKLVVPAGFAIAEDSADRIRDGVVITDAKENGNEFVWVPVDDINTMVMCKSKKASEQCNIQFNSDETALTCKTHNDSTDICGKLYATAFGNNFNSALTSQKYDSSVLFREPDKLSVGDADSSGLEKISSIVGLEEDITTDEGINKILTKWNEMLDEEYKKMSLEVAKKGGFYVGRYETSVDDNGNVQSKKNVEVSDSTLDETKSWYGLYKKQKEFRTITMKSSMIWGSQYDVMMLWMLENNINITSLTPTTDASKNTSKTHTGYNDKDQLNKVYDLLGSRREWTLEAASTSARTYRGGYYGGNSTPSNRSSFSPYQENSMYGSRMVLY